MPYDPVPSHLYKYRSLRGAQPDEERDRTKDIIVNHRMWWSTAVSFNDPFDCATPITIAGTKAQRDAYFTDVVHNVSPGANRKERRTMKRATARARGPVLERALEDATAENRARTGICCLSTYWDRILMWSHYADAHHGICLRFDTTKDAQFRGALPVIYAEERPIVNMVTTPRRDLADPLILTKAKMWEYEGERRMLDVAGPGYHRFAVSALDQIILGAAISLTDEAAVREWAAATPQIQIVKSQLHARRFELTL